MQFQYDFFDKNCRSEHLLIKILLLFPLQNLHQIIPQNRNKTQIPQKVTHIIRQVHGIRQLVKQVATREHSVCLSMKQSFQRGMIKNQPTANRSF